MIQSDIYGIDIDDDIATVVRISRLYIHAYLFEDNKKIFLAIHIKILLHF